MDYKAAYEKLLKEKARLDRQVSLIKKTVNSKTYNLGEKFFSTIIKTLNEAISADYTFVGELINDKVKTIAVFGGKQAS